MRTYLELLERVLTHGQQREDRTGTGVLSIFGAQCRYDLRVGFPLVTTKRVHTRSVIYELLWFLGGHTNVDYLREHGVSIWDEWADEQGELGPVYGKQWRAWEGAEGIVVDQIARLIDGLRTDPLGRRHIVNAWNVGELDKMALPPCHLLFQFYVHKGELSCHLYQRSADLFLGVPFNIASYALLTHMVAQVCDLRVGEFVHTMGDAHIYLNHLAQVKEQLGRKPRELPQLALDASVRTIDDFRFESVRFERYNPHPAIRAPVAV